jgi:hypothetical protein
MSAAQKTLLGALALTVALLVGLTVDGLREESSRGTRAAARASRAELPSATEPAPWHAAADEPVSELPPGTVPVSRIDPPRPDLAMPLPQRPVEPPNPALHRPPMDNPGGVNGDRPERPSP